MGFVERGGIGDALAALLGWKGCVRGWTNLIDQDMSRTDKPGIHGGRCLDGQQLVHQLAIEASPKGGKRLRTDKMSLMTMSPNFTDATRLHDGKIGAQSITNGLVRTSQFVFEQFQGEPHPNLHTGTTSSRLFRKAPLKALFDCGDELIPGKGIGP